MGLQLFLNDVFLGLSNFGKKNWLPTVKVVAPLIVLNAGLLAGLSIGLKSWAHTGYLLSAVFGLFTFVLLGAVLYSTFNLIDGKKKKPHHAWIAGGFYAPSLFLTTFILIAAYYALGIVLTRVLGALGGALLAFGGLYIKARLFLIYPILVKEGVKPVQAIMTSWAQTGSSVWHIILVLFVLGLFLRGPSLFILMPTGSLPVTDPDFLAWKLSFWLLLFLVHVHIALFVYRTTKKNY